MISDKFIKEYHLKETTWYFGERKNSFNAIILVDKQKGMSVKPFWDDEEKQRFIELFVAYGNSRRETIKRINEPDFCFAAAGKNSKVNELRKAIANGNFDVLDSYSNNPVCPFA